MTKAHRLTVWLIGLCVGSVLCFISDVNAAEGGYGNYVPGTYGDFGMAGAPAGKLTLRNDVYFYDADTPRAVRSGRVEAEIDLVFLANFTSLFYNPGI